MENPEVSVDNTSPEDDTKKKSGVLSKLNTQLTTGVDAYAKSMAQVAGFTRVSNVAFVTIAIIFNLTTMSISIALRPRLEEIKDNFESCPDRWLQKQGHLMYDWNVCTFVIVAIASVHMLLKSFKVYADFFDPFDGFFQCAQLKDEKKNEDYNYSRDLYPEDLKELQKKDGETIFMPYRLNMSVDSKNLSDSVKSQKTKEITWKNSFKCFLWRSTGAFMKCLEAFLITTSPLLPTIMWAYFYVFPFDTLNSLLHGKHEGTDDYFYDEAWRNCVPKHTDQVYNNITVMMIAGISSAWLLCVADFGKNPANVAISFYNSVARYFKFDTQE